VDEGIKAASVHSRRIGDITIKLTTEPLKCGIRGIERNEYIRKGEGDLIILGGLPGSGKTAFAWQIASSVAEHGRVLFFSLEMSAESLKKRGLAALAQVPVKKLGHPIHKLAVDRASQMQNLLNLSVIDEGESTINDIMSKAFDEHRASPLDLIVIDYIGLIDVDDGSRHIHLGKAAEKLRKDLAQVINVPVLCLSQLNSGFEGRYNQYLLAREKAKYYPDYKPLKNLMRPCLDDLAESKRIGRAADTVLFIHRPWIMDKECSASKITVFVGKYRHGDPQDFELDFTQEQMRFYDTEGEI
jgi:replicative DNA helicase